MALKPSISLSLGNKCNKVTFTETTNPYMFDTNEGGWGDPNLDASDIVDAKVRIYNYQGTTLLATYDITDNYSSALGYPTPNSFVILEDAAWTLSDGIYKIVYSIETEDEEEDSEVFNSDLQHELFTCNLCNCLDKLIQRLVKACDTKKVQELKLQVDQIEILLYGIQTAFSCGDFETATTILESATTYCQTLSDCGCGCNDC
jgi:hypothetical protein